MERLTIIRDDLLSIIILSGFVADQYEVPLMAVGAAEVVHQVRAVLQTSVTLSREWSTANTFGLVKLFL